MNKIKKRGIPLVLAMMFILSVFATSAAAATPQPKASKFIRDAYASVRAAGSGKVTVTVNVSATAAMTKIGTTTISIQQSTNGSSWTTVKTYSSSSVSALLGSGTSYNKTPVTYQGTKGYKYRAVVTCYAANASGSDSKVYTTSAVTAT